MRTQPLILACFLLLMLPIPAQTADQLAQEYRPVAAFEARPGILLVPRFADNGEVCEIKLERVQSLESQADNDAEKSSRTFKGLIDEIAPPNERGREAEFLLPDSEVIGESSRIVRDFDNVVIEEDGTVSSGVEMVAIRWKWRTCAATRSTSPK